MQRFLWHIIFFVGILNSIYSQSQTGIASVRHLAHEGELTKAGEFFSHDSLVASHRSIPFGSIVKITNLSNQQSVDVRINDRGPFIKGHIVDLSEAAGLKIGLLNQDRTEVRLDVIKIESNFKIKNTENLQSATGEYGVKMGSFGEKNNAIAYSNELKTVYGIENSSITTSEYNGKTIFRVYIGRFSSRALAERYLAQLPEKLQNGYVTKIE
jgi:rare lipoprotein A